MPVENALDTMLVCTGHECALPIMPIKDSAGLVNSGKINRKYGPGA